MFQGVHITHEEGTSQYTTSQWRGGFKRYHQRNWDGAVAYAPADQVQSITLAVTEVLQNTTPTGSGVEVAKHTELQSKQQQLAACKDDACKKQVITAWDKLS